MKVPLSAVVLRLVEPIVIAAAVLGILAAVFLATGGSCVANDGALVCAWSAP
jgi:hypothetical protein